MRNKHWRNFILLFCIASILFSTLATQDYSDNGLAVWKQGAIGISGILFILAIVSLNKALNQDMEEKNESN